MDKHNNHNWMNAGFRGMEMVDRNRTYAVKHHGPRDYRVTVTTHYVGTDKLGTFTTKANAMEYAQDHANG